MAEPQCNVIVTRTLAKLRSKHKICCWADFEELGELGKGAFGRVLRVRKRDGGAEYAAKVLTDVKPGQAAFSHEQLSELKALFKVKKGWQAFDCLDEDWCPIVQLHGIFTDISAGGWALYPGLLMENFGYSLWKILHPLQDPLVAKLEAARKEKLPEFCDRCRERVARNVASACRYLHDVGIMHRDLKDQNVLVDPYSGYRAKLTDFGTSRTTRAVQQTEVAGTLQALAPEALVAMDPDRAQAQEAPEIDPRPVDVYAYAILLCALWDGDRDPRRHVPQPANGGRGGDTNAALRRYLQHVGREKLRPAVPEDMPPLYARLMQACWLDDPDARPTFSSICNTLKKELRSRPSDARSPRPPGSAARVALVVRYSPSVEWHADEVVFTLEATFARRDAALALADGVTDGVASFSFPFIAGVGEALEVSLGHVFGADGDTGWLGTASCAHLLSCVPPLDADAAGAPAPAAHGALVLRPDWDKAGELPAEGKAAALMLIVKRAGEKQGRYLGALQLHLPPPDAKLERTASRAMNRMPTLLRGARFDVMLSYRDTETGMKGSNFAFRLQEALEAVGYTVFCYAAAVGAGSRWMSPFNNGVCACDAFIPLCSPEYGDMDVAPWSAAELLQAVRQHDTTGRPHIIPIRHHGEYPHCNADTAGVLARFECVPDPREYPDTVARRMKYDDVWQLVIARLQDVGIHPRTQHGAAPAGAAMEA